MTKTIVRILGVTAVLIMLVIGLFERDAKLAGLEKQNADLRQIVAEVVHNQNEIVQALTQHAAVITGIQPLLVWVDGEMRKADLIPTQVIDGTEDSPRAASNPIAPPDPPK